MIEVESKKIPHSFRNKYLRNSGSVSLSTSTPMPSTGGQGVEVLKTDDIRTVSDSNVFSSLRALLEIKSRIVAMSDNDTELSDDNTLSSLRALKETQDIVDREILKALEKAESLFLSKTKDDKTTGHLTIDGGVTTDLLQSSQFTSGTFGSGLILKRDPNTGESYLEVDKAYIRKKAIFNSLEIKEAYHVGGEQIQTLASIKCTKVESIYREALFDSDHKRLRDSDGKYLFALLTEPVYRCYFVNDDGEKAIVNQFVVGDFAQSRQFDIKGGVYEGVSNRYYWRYVSGIGDNYIDLSVDDCEEGSDIPAAGDTIIQLGNRTNADRQNAIIMSAYGENAPSKQMLQGINSYTLADKVILEEGFDRLTNQAYTKNYGKLYIGDKAKESYLEYDPQKGISLNGTARIIEGTIKLKVNDTDSWEVDENCVNTIGNKSGEHIEINPSSKNIRIFDELGDNVAAFEGKKYNSVESLFPVVIPDVIITQSFPLTRTWNQIGEVTETLSLTAPFYTSTSIIVSCPHTGIIQIDNYNTTACRYRMTFDTYSDSQCTQKIDSSLITGLIVEVFGTHNINAFNNNVFIPAGYHKVNLLIGSNNTPGSVCHYSLITFSVDIKIDAYLSKYFGNGLVLGTGSKNLVSIISKEKDGDKYISFLARNDKNGIEVNNNDIYSYRNGGIGMIPSIICCGLAGTTNSGAFLDRQKTFDGSYLSASRISEGVCRISFPDSWRKLNIGVGRNAYVMLTGVGSSFPGEGASPIKATLRSILQGVGFDVYISDDATVNDGSFYFEVKWY